MTGGIDYESLPIYRGELADAVGFSTDDLDANRSGRLSETQRTKLARAERNRIGFVAVCVVVVAVCLAILWVAGVRSVGDLKFVLLAIVFVSFAAMGAISARDMWRDLGSGRVSTSEGFISSTVSETSGAQTYYWVVGGMRFQVTGDMYSVLAPGHYRLYFLPRTRRVVSIEPADASPQRNEGPSE